MDFLGGRASREEVLQSTSIKGVEVIGCGSRKMAGPELLASSTMSQFLISLRTSYGVIIIDTAPLGAGVDPLVLGTLTGNIVLVLRTGVSDREFTMAKLAAMSRLPIRVLGRGVERREARGWVRLLLVHFGLRDVRGGRRGARPGSPQPAVRRMTGCLGRCLRWG